MASANASISSKYYYRITPTTQTMLLEFANNSKWQPTPVLLPRKSHGQRSLVQATVHGVAKSQT